MKKITNININLGDGVPDYDIKMILDDIADKIENGYYSGIVGWSDVSWDITKEEVEDEEDG